MDLLEEELLSVTNERAVKKRFKRFKIALWVMMMVNVAIAFSIGMTMVGFSSLGLWVQVLYVLVTYFLFIPLGVVVFLLGLLVALFWKKGTYASRLFSFFRIAFFVVLILNTVLLILFGIGKYNIPFNENPFIAKDYETVEYCLDNTDDIKTGTFYYSGYKYSRDESFQYETNPETGEVTAYTIEWLSDCEYTLTVIDESQSGVKQLWVKVVENNDDFYSFYMTWDRKEAVFYKMYKSPQ